MNGRVRPQHRLLVDPGPYGTYRVTYAIDGKIVTLVIPATGLVTPREALKIIDPPVSRWRLLWWLTVARQPLLYFRWRGTWLIPLDHLRRFVAKRGRRLLGQESIPQ